jgi:predicted HD phosphohydrolase
MTAEECVEFEKNPFYQDAVKLRKYDDLAKIPDLEVKPVAFYASYLESFTL